MPARAFDAIVIGGGFVGLGTAYELARRGASVLLLERAHLGSGTSGAGAGRAQVGEAHPGLHLELVLRGLQRLDELEDELGRTFEWRKVSNTMLIAGEDGWREWSAQVALLKLAGVPAEILSPAATHDAEPALRTEGFLGAAWCKEGHLDPFQYLHAFANAARRHGALVYAGTPATELVLRGDRVGAVVTPAGRFESHTVVVACGAWTSSVLSLAGARLPIRYTQNEALITDRRPAVFNGHIGLADFYDTVHGRGRGVSPGATQQANGTVLITGAVSADAGDSRRSTAWGARALASAFLALCPGLAGARAVRGWAALSPFAPDASPVVGRMPDFANLWVAACLHLCVTTMPVLCDLLARSILGEETGISIDCFSPARLAAGL